jgi:hypothetical protein
LSTPERNLVFIYEGLFNAPVPSSKEQGEDEEEVVFICDMCGKVRHPDFTENGEQCSSDECDGVMVKENDLKHVDNEGLEGLIT